MVDALAGTEVETVHLGAHDYQASMLTPFTRSRDRAGCPRQLDACAWSPSSLDIWIPTCRNPLDGARRHCRLVHVRYRQYQRASERALSYKDVDHCRRRLSTVVPRGYYWAEFAFPQLVVQRSRGAGRYRVSELEAAAQDRS
jgi:hypothetical protein